MYDAYKMFSDYDQVPQMYTTANNDQLSINTLPSIDQNSAIPLGFKAGVSGLYSITASGMESFDTGTPIWLEDKTLNTSTNLKTNPAYSFTYNTGDNADRFVVHFKSALGLNTPESHKMIIYANGNTIFINPGTEKLQGEVIVYDILGNKIVKDRLNNESSIYSININNPMGYYMVKVISDKGVYTQKVFIQ
jgi:hypothetical protein